jgi:hypothetical protein
MAGFMTELGAFFAPFIELLGDVVTFIAANPLILFPVILSVAVLVIGVVKRFLPRRG